MKKILIALGFVLTLGACQTDNPNTLIGTGLGAGGGALIGNQIGSGSGRTAATIGGAIIGGLAGGAIGNNMDQNNRRNMIDNQCRILYDAYRNPVRVCPGHTDRYVR